MAGLTISLLGPPRIEVSGEPICVDTRKAIALLAYLAVERDRKSRDSLAALLWPDQDTSHARGALRRTLSSLTKGLGGQFLDVERSAVRLDATDVRLDVEAFRELAAAERDAEAAALYRGEFLEGFGLRDSVAFEDWQLFEADSLRRTYAGVLERLARARAEAGRLDEGVDLARRWLALDELHEPAQQLLIELYARSGDRMAALQQYRECVRVLDRELGVSPLEETTALYASINENAFAPAPRPAPGTAASAPRVPGGYRLVGRDRERRLLAEALAAASPDGRLVVVEGEAGIGKTRLVDELAEQARADGLPVARMRCSETESTLAYAVVADAIRDALAAPGASERLAALPVHWAAEAARLVPELAENGHAPAPSGEGPGARGRFLEGLSNALVASARLVVVDDAHWIDEGSLEVLAYVARRLHGRPICLAFTWRTEEVPPGHALRRLVAEAERGGAATTIVPARLHAGEVAELAAFAGAPELAARVYEESDGLPFFVVEYLAAAAEAGPGEWPLPGSVAGLVSARVASAGETAHQVLTAAAVLGRSFDFETVRDVSGRGDDEAVAALEELTRRRLLEELAEGYDFGHDRVRELVYGETSLARRRLLHARAAEVIAARERRDPGAQAVVVADHFRLGGRESEAARYLVIAGDRARNLYANADALAHFRAALALGHPEPAWLHEAVGDLQVLQGDYAAAIASYETAAALAPASGLPELERKLGVIHERRGDYGLAESHFRTAAAAERDSDPSWAAGLEVDRALNEHRRGDVQAALAHARHGLELAEQSGESVPLARAHNVLGVLASAEGRTDEARDELARSLELAERLADPAPRIAALNNLALVARSHGQLDEAIALELRALAACRSYGDRHREAAIHGNLADALREAGRGEEAMEHLKLGVAIFAEVGGDPADLRPEIWKLVEW